MTTPVFTRRNALLSGIFGSGYVGLKAIATGLPAWFIANPRKATAADLACAIEARENLQYLIMNVSSMGDPISCNCPGTYEGDAAAAIHPDDQSMAPVAVTLGSKQYTRRRRGKHAARFACKIARTELLPPRHAGEQPRRPAEGARA